jgi:hypothetical protein
MVPTPMNLVRSSGTLLSGLVVLAGCGGSGPESGTLPQPVVNPAPASDPCYVAADGAPIRDTVIVALPPGPAERFLAAHQAARVTAVDCEGVSRSSPLPAFRVASTSPAILTPIDTSRARWVILARIAEPNTDPRDLMDRGADVVITSDPAALEYARHRQDLRLVPLAWATTYALVTPPGSTPPAIPESLGAELARDVVRAESRPAQGPAWWESSPECRAAAPASSGTRIALAVPARDATARAIGERMVALLGPGSPGIRLVEYGGDEFDAALADGRASVFVIPLRRLPPGFPGCPEGYHLPIGSTVVPLVDTRATAVLRSGVPAFRIQGDGSIRFVTPAVP